MAGSISSIGVGSGLDLQGILEQLREVDDKAILQPKETRVDGYEAQLEEFTVVKNKLFSMKSAALDLSLASTFLTRSVTSSDEDVLTATVADGASAQNATITVTSLAAKSSWMSATGASSEDAIVYVPTGVQSSAGVANAAATNIAASDGTFSVTYGGTKTISVAVGPTSGTDTLDELITAINTEAVNITGSGANGRYVTASKFQVDSAWYLRVESDTVGASGETHRVAVATNGTSFTVAAPAKTFAYTMGDETTSIAVAADTTLSQLVDLINDDADNPGITASIIDDGQTNPYRLVMQANDTGEDSRIDLLTQLPNLTISEQTGAGGSSLNARISVDGISYQRQDNSFNDVLSGVTINLKGAGSASVSVSSNTDSVKTMITDLVTAYNELVQEVGDNVAYDEDAGTFGVLAGTTMRNLPYELQYLMTQTVTADADGKVRTMFDLGLEFNRDGTISIDTEVLDSMLADYPDSVEAFFLGDDDAGVTGFADNVNERLRVLTSSNGQVEAEKSSAQGRIDALKLQITTETERLNKKYELLTKQFIELDRYMKQMTSISSYLTSQFSSLSQTASK